MSGQDGGGEGENTKGQRLNLFSSFLQKLIIHSFKAVAHHHINIL